MIDEPITSEDAIQSGQSLAKNVKEESSTFVKKESANLRKTKEKEIEWAPVNYTESKTRMRRSKSTPFTGGFFML